MLDYSDLLNSIITATSVFVAAGFPIIVIIATNYKTRKEKLLHEMKTYYTQLNLFRSLIYHLFQTGVVKNYDKSIVKVKSKKEKENIEESYNYRFYKAIDYISKKYINDIENESLHNRVFCYEEIKRYQNYSNVIWYGINCRTDVIQDLRINLFNELSLSEVEEILDIVYSLNFKNRNNNITIGLFANIAGMMETEVLNPLAYLSKKYEEPFPSLAKGLFFTLTIVLTFGVIVPLMLIQFEIFQKIWISISLVIILVFCFLMIVFFIGKYIRRIEKD